MMLMLQVLLGLLRRWLMLRLHLLLLLKSLLLQPKPDRLILKIIPPPVVLKQRHNLRSVVVVIPKVSEILGALDCWQVWWLHGLSLKLPPVKSSKEIMLPKLWGAQPFIWISSAQPTDQILGILRHLPRERSNGLHSPTLDFLLDLVRVLGFKGRMADQKLEGQDSSHPPVVALVVTSALDHLWSHVVWCAHQRVRLLLVVADFCEAHVRQLAVPCLVEQ